MPPPVRKKKHGGGYDFASASCALKRPSPAWTREGERNYLPQKLGLKCQV